MTPKEKRNELIEKYWNAIINDDDGDRYNQAKQCALIAVDEIIDEIYGSGESIKRFEYWKEVKQEINNL